MTDSLRRTALNPVHKQMGAKMVPFGGWEMPVEYSGIIQEHMAVRTRAGLFDVSHMGEVTERGREALNLVQFVTCNDAGPPGRWPGPVQRLDVSAGDAGRRPARPQDRGR